MGLEKKKSYGERSIKWMEGYIGEPLFLVLIDGTSKGFFRYSLGLRHGDCLSPFLFIMADRLSVILRKVEQAHLVEGFVIGDDNIMVSHCNL